MLSICIPVYNQNIKTLVDSLFAQVEAQKDHVEIVVIDDASDEEYQRMNAQNCVSKAKYVQLKENIGRARIRNLFLQFTNHAYLVFLDCDVVIPDFKFVQKYIDFAKKQSPSVVAGGHYYSAENVTSDKQLRWKFGVNRESPKADQRMQNPYKSFKTSNFMVNVDLFKKINFDESIKGYGHEDTLFGYNIKKQRIPIHHIENPVLIPDLDTNREFITKTKRSIENLVEILPKVNYDPNFINDITLLRAYYSIKQKRMLWVVNIGYVFFSRFILRQLNNGKASLRMFDFFKLAYLTKINK